MKYSSDTPIFKKSQDRFSRWNFAHRVAEVVSKRQDPSSIVIGIYGAWGDGKTTVLNFIEESLENNNDVICVKFNPWRFGTEDELLSGFFFNIAEALDTKLIKKGDKLKELVKKNAPSAGSFLGVKGVGEVISSFISTLNVTELKIRIENELEVAKKRVLILIDDVDRLEKSEIHALFRLVKLTADFKYTSYILAFDKDVVVASLQDRYSSSIKNGGESFLEKIIQVPLHLPTIEKQILREFCFQCIDEAIDISKIILSQEQIQEFIRNFSFTFDDCLTTPRKAKLYGNILMFSLPILQGEVNPVDLMLIEGIRVFCPALYEILRSNKNSFVGTLNNSIYSNTDNEKEQIKKIIDSAFKNEEISKEPFIELLKNMFPKIQAVYGNMTYGSEWYKEWDKGQRICSENYYTRYFTYAIPKRDIADNMILNLCNDCKNWEVPYDEENNPLNEILIMASAEMLIKKLRSIASNLDIEVSRALAIAISQKSESIPNPIVLYSWTTPLSQAAMLISDLIQNLQDIERINLAKECIKFSSTLEFKIEIFQWLKRLDEDRPENDYFSEQSIDTIGKYLAEDISIFLKDTGSIGEIIGAYIPKVFSVFNSYCNKNHINNYIEQQIKTNPTLITKILDSYVPTSWEMETGMSRKSDFEREHYNSLARHLTPSILFEAIQNNFPEAINITDDFPRGPNENNSDKLRMFIKQFAWLYKDTLSTK